MGVSDLFSRNIWVGKQSYLLLYICTSIVCIFLKILFIYLTDRDHK